MATWSAWFKSAKEKNIDFPLKINQEEDLKRLYNSGLPCQDRLFIQGENFNFEKSKIIAFAIKNPQVWIRISNKINKGERYIKFDLRGYEEISAYVNSLQIDLPKFNIQIYEFQENKFGGNIVSKNREVYIDIIPGSQYLIENSKNNYFHAFVDEFGNLKFTQEINNEIYKAAKNALNYLKTSRNEYLEGYFEFIVSNNEKVYFLDYKLRFK